MVSCLRSVDVFNESTKLTVHLIADQMTRLGLELEYKHQTYTLV